LGRRGNFKGFLLIARALQNWDAGRIRVNYVTERTKCTYSSYENDFEAKLFGSQNF